MPTAKQKAQRRTHGGFAQSGRPIVFLQECRCRNTLRRTDSYCGNRPLADAEAIHERYASDAEVTKYLGWPRHQSIEETKAFLAHSEAEWNRWPAGPYLIECRGDRKLLGGTGFTFEAPTVAITGYVLARDAWGYGYATEALSTVVALSRQLGVQRRFV